MNICVIGLGYVGTVTAASLASKGNKVIGVDLDQTLVDELNLGRSKFYEPGLEEILRRGLDSGHLRATTSVEEALSDSKIVIVSVGTPSAEDGSTDLRAIRGVVRQLINHVTERTGHLTIVVTSTLAPGSTSIEFCAPLLDAVGGDESRVDFAFCPEFLREGTAIEDFVRPELSAIGCASSSTFSTLAELYKSETGAPVRMTIEEAESVKFLSNAWHALKVSFANEAGRYLNSWGIDSQKVMDVFLQDKKLNVSERYLRPGFAFGGSCLPKDVRSLEFQTKFHGTEAPVFWAINQSNLRHLDFALEKVISLNPQRVLMLGLAFKANTSDLRESAPLWLATKLLAKGVTLSVFDFHVQAATVRSASGLQGVHVEESIEDALARDWDLVLVAQANKRFNSALSHSKSPVLDLAGSAYSLAGDINYSGLTW